MVAVADLCRTDGIKKEGEFIYDFLFLTVAILKGGYLQK